MHLQLHPSVPRSPKGTSLSPLLSSSTKENYGVPPNYSVLPPHPDYTHFGPRPSDGWLKNPAYMDGGVNPPRFYYTNDEIAQTMLIWNPGHPMFQAPAPDVPATAPTLVPIDPVLLAMSTPTPTPLELAGNQVSVVMLYSTLEKPTGSRVTKPTTKKHKTSKFDYIKIQELSRCDFVTAALKVHESDGEYSPGVHNGPSFKMSWTGSSGGKAGAVTIDNDRDWQLAAGAVSKKNMAAIVVEFDLDQMEGYRVRKRSPSLSSSDSSCPPTPSPCPRKSLPQREAQDDDPELLYGTKVPKIDDFTPQAQLNGHMVLKLSEKWSCEKHQGEHGECGHCWIDSSGNHVGLNMRKKALWAAAIVAREATIHEPPNTVDFDGLRDGRLTSTRPRGRGGPRAAASGGASSDATAILLAAMLPIISNLSSKPSMTDPTERAVPGTPMKATLAPLSPVPALGSELHACLTDFLWVKDIDILAAETSLSNLDLTPDIIPQVPMARLVEITGVIEGRLWKFQSFCRDWTDRCRGKKAPPSASLNMTLTDLKRIPLSQAYYSISM
ncbi:hypothetical protein C8J57DRAFT_1251772 [Mycena rebaudengoi]|nr:hypothetical protein C8J57DRAFT_1251772 [Mycena rebaudengoi]